MHRLIVTSAAYRQASRVRDARAEARRRRQPPALAGQPAAAGRRGRPRRRAGRLRGAQPHGSAARASRTSRSTGRARTPTTSSPTRPASSRRRSTAARSTASGRGRGTTRCSSRSTAPTRRSWRRRRTRTITPVQALSHVEQRLHGEVCRAVRRAGPPRSGRRRCAAGRAGLAAGLRRGRRTIAKRGSPDRFVARHGLDQLCLVLFNANEFLFVD